MDIDYNTTDNINIDMKSSESVDENMEGGANEIPDNIKIHKNLAERIHIMIFNETYSLDTLIREAEPLISYYGPKNNMNQFINNYKNKIGNKEDIEECINKFRYYDKNYKTFNNECAEKLNDILEAADNIRKTDSGFDSPNFPAIGLRFKKIYSEKDIKIRDNMKKKSDNEHRKNMEIFKQALEKKKQEELLKQQSVTPQRRETAPEHYTHKEQIIEHRKSAPAAYIPTPNPSGYPNLPKLSPKTQQTSQPTQHFLPKNRPPTYYSELPIPMTEKKQQPSQIAEYTRTPFIESAYQEKQTSQYETPKQEQRPLPQAPLSEHSIKNLTPQEERHNILEKLAKCQYENKKLEQQIDEIEREMDFGGGSSENYENYDEIYYRNKMNYLNLKNK